MTQILLKRVYEPAAPGDGYRILVDRLWPRGMRKEALAFDLWPKDAAPSNALRQWYHADPEGRWPEFRKKYAGELLNSPAFRDLFLRIADLPTVTLLYGAKNTAENHAMVLRQQLLRALASVVSEPTGV